MYVIDFYESQICYVVRDYFRRASWIIHELIIKTGKSRRILFGWSQESRISSARKDGVIREIVFFESAYIADGNILDASGGESDSQRATPRLRCSLSYDIAPRSLRRERYYFWHSTSQRHRSISSSNGRSRTSSSCVYVYVCAHRNRSRVKRVSAVLFAVGEQGWRGAGGR